MTGRSDLVRVDVEDLDDTYLGTQLLVTADGATVAGGVSDLVRLVHDCADHPGRLTVLVYLAGQLVRLEEDAVVLAELTPTALDALADS